MPKDARHRAVAAPAAYAREPELEFLEKATIRGSGWIWRRLTGWVRRKGAWFFICWLLLSNLDLFFGLEGRLTRIGLIALPSLVFLAVLQIDLRYNGGSAISFKQVALAMTASATLGLLKAWSAAAGASLPAWLSTTGIVLFGMPVSLILSGIDSVFGWRLPSPVPLLHPDGWTAHLWSLDPLLVAVSLAMFILAIRQMRFVETEWGGVKAPIPPERAHLLKNRFYTDTQAHRILRRR